MTVRRRLFVASLVVLNVALVLAFWRWGLLPFPLVVGWRPRGLWG